MLARQLTKTIFNIQKNTDKHLRQLDPSTSDVLEQRRNLRREVRKTDAESVPA